MRWLGRITALILLVSAIMPPLLQGNSVAAITASDWRAGRIIDDSVFTNADNMSVSDIQAFLNSKVPSCDTNGTKPATEFGRSDLTHAQYAATRGWAAPPYICLRNYYEVPKTDPGPGIPANNYSGSIPSGAISAAQMIYNAAQKYSINPKVLLVMIQKESAGPLTTDTWPLPGQYTYAMGAHCPDSGPGGSANCDANYAGFSLQISESAALLRWYLDSMDQSWWQYKKPFQTNSILWNVAQTGCGAGNVYIESKATAALYTYTPYQPNAAALANMYGTGDGCSAYGNRNFWRIYSDWFGPTYGVKITAVPYDSTTDKTGDQAVIGFKLSSKPSADVYIKYTVSSSLNARLLGRDTVKITPESWDKPEENILKVIGLNNPDLIGTLKYWLSPVKITSNDYKYNGISPDYIGSVSLLQQDNYNPPEVYRLANSSSRQYSFTASPAQRDELVANGWVNEGLKFYYCYTGEQIIYKFIKGDEQRLVVAGSQDQTDAVAAGFALTDIALSASSQGNVPVYWQYNKTEGRTFYSTNPNEGTAAGFTSMGVAFYSCQPNQQTVYRVVDPSSGTRLYTTATNERDYTVNNLGFRYEGLSFYACMDGEIPVYRLVSKTKGDRLYTVSASERDRAVAQYNYRDEGIEFKTCTDGTRPVYRLVSKTNGDRLYTVSSSERDRAVANYNYRDEGTAFYAQ